MRECSQPKHVHVSSGNNEVPQEVAGSKALDHAACAAVAPYPLFLAHGLSLVVDKHDPKRNDVNHAALEKRHAVCVPADLPAVGELRIGMREEGGREDGRQRIVDEAVEKAGR